MTDDRPTTDYDALRALIPKVRDAVAYSYEAGDYPDMEPDVAAYFAGDGGLLRTLDVVLGLLDEVERLRAWRDVVSTLFAAARIARGTER